MGHPHSARRIDHVGVDLSDRRICVDQDRRQRKEREREKCRGESRAEQRHHQRKHRERWQRPADISGVDCEKRVVRPPREPNSQRNGDRSGNKQRRRRQRDVPPQRGAEPVGMLNDVLPRAREHRQASADRAA